MNDTTELIEAARVLAEEQIAPMARTLDETSWSNEAWDLLSDLGVTAISAPEEYGGLGLPYSAYLAVTEQLARVSAVAALVPSLNVLVIRALLRAGSDEAKARYLPGLVAGRLRGCWAFTESETGSDPKAIRTTARPAPSGDGWLLSGGKMFISHSGHADVAVVFAQLDGRLTAFLGETTDGFTPGRREPLLGLAGLDTGTVDIDGMHVHEILGDPGDGFRILLSGEAEAKLRASAACSGLAWHATQLAVDYARSREHRGTPIGEKFQTIQWLVAECAARAETIQALIERGSRLVDAGGDITAPAAKIKLMASRLAREVTSDAMQVHGAYGYTRDNDIEMLYRQAKMFEVVQGVSELNRVIIARDALGLSHG